MNRNKNYIILSIIGALAVLWSLLLPGYLMTLDMVFGPHIAPPILEGLKAAAYPLRALIYLLHFILPVWVIQKFLLLGIVSLLFYMPLRFYPVTNKYGEAYLTSLLFAINPFVYERFLAGQWVVLLAYALLPAFLYFLVQFHRKQSRNNLVGIFLILLIIGIVSFHFLAIASIIFLIYFLLNLKHWKPLVLGGLAFLVLSLYWIIPVLTQDNNLVSTFSGEHWEAFQTATDPSLGVIGNILTLHGFWGESWWWVAQWEMPKEHWWWPGTLASLLALVGAGLARGWKEHRKETFFLIGLGLLAVIFSSGISGPFRTLNLWFFEHIPFWQGFRDTQKWSGLLALVYALLVGLGARALLEKLGNHGGRVTVVALCLLPILYTPNMLLGFSSQLKPVWYPTSWIEADKILKADTECKAIFLPWHQYYALKFNHGVLTGNTAKAFFSCEVTIGQNMELGTVSTQEGNTAEYYEIESMVTANNKNSKEVVDFLRGKGFKYIIFSTDLIDQDIFAYPFLGSKNLKVIFNGENLYLLSI